MTGRFRRRHPKVIATLLVIRPINRPSASSPGVKPFSLPVGGKAYQAARSLALRIECVRPGGIQVFNLLQDRA